MYSMFVIRDMGNGIKEKEGGGGTLTTLQKMGFAERGVSECVVT